MIIKRIPIKTVAGVKRVLEYIATDKGSIPDYHKQSIWQNVLSTDLDNMGRQFERNFKEFAHGRNKTVGNHIVLAYNPMDKKKLDLKRLDQLTREYITKAFPNAICFATHHVSNESKHTHLLVSGNDYLDKTSTRQDKQTLMEVHHHMLDYIEREFSDLTIGIDRDKYGTRNHSEAEYYQRKRNPHKLLEKDSLTKEVQRIFRMSESTEHFKELLSVAGYRTYDRKGQLQGVYGLFGGNERQLRFGRLGIETKHLEELNIQNERLVELESIREEQELINDLENEQEI